MISLYPAETNSIEMIKNKDLFALNTIIILSIFVYGCTTVFFLNLYLEKVKRIIVKRTVDKNETKDKNAGHTCAPRPVKEKSSKITVKALLQPPVKICFRRLFQKWRRNRGRITWKNITYPRLATTIVPAIWDTGALSGGGGEKRRETKTGQQRT